MTLPNQVQLGEVPISHIFLWDKNPRHQPLKDEAAVIARLCQEEDVLALARDIVNNGISPIERLALVPIGKGKKQGDTYTVHEGNRRICALKLLIDPDKAPPQYRERFLKLSNRWEAFESVQAAIFADPKNVKIWLERVHTGPQGGVGRKSWSPEQKQRFQGTNKNRTAQNLLDYAQGQSFITEAERKGRLTTAQRLLNVQEFRDALGLEVDDSDILQRTRPDDDFKELVKAFLGDLIKGVAHSRMNNDDIKKYAETLSAKTPSGERRIERQPIRDADPIEPSVEEPTKPAKPAAPATPKTIPRDDAIADALKSAAHQKLESLYYSITNIDVAKHTPFLTVGVWSFLEILMACAGSTVAFDAFLSKDRLKTLTGKSEVKAETQAIKRLAELGNTTKHEPIAGSFNPAQLVNDMAVLSPVIVKLAEQITSFSAGRP